jgi:hypothetical protein
MSKKKQCRAKKLERVAQPARHDRPVPRHEQQLALIGDVVLDIEAAFQLLRSKPRSTVRIDVESWARTYGMDGTPDSPVRLGPLFDHEHSRTADLRRPLILATFVVAEGDEAQVIADGSHRLFRAFTEGRDSLPGWILTAAETEAITVAGPTLKGCTKP